MKTLNKKLVLSAALVMLMAFTTNTFATAKVHALQNTKTESVKKDSKEKREVKKEVKNTPKKHSSKKHHKTSQHHSKK